MRLARLRDHAAVGDQLLRNVFPLNRRHLHTRDWFGFFLAASADEMLPGAVGGKYDHDGEQQRASNSLHFKCMAAFDGRKQPEAISNAVCASSSCSCSLINWIRFCSRLLRAV